jgi:molybdenum transport protein
MLNYIPDSDIDRFIEEDVPYGDLTTCVLGISNAAGQIVFTSREETTICCTEEAGRIFEKFGAHIVKSLSSGTAILPGTDFLVVQGNAGVLHSGWKAALNLLEYASGISSRTARIVKAARDVNSSIMIGATRKSFPGTKRISVKAVSAGGALHHRLGLSETILVFKQHTAFLGGLDKFISSIGDIRQKVKETKIIVEAENSDEAKKIAEAGADILQVDKMSPAELMKLVKKIRIINPAIKISAAGGINESNAAEYASTGVDILVLSSVFFGKPADIGVRMIPV